jgi:hypothetical protein
MAPPLPEPEALPPPPPPPLPAMKECCICFLDVRLDDLLLLMPCAHRCVCEACAEALVAADPERRRCPKSRKSVSGASRVFDD